MTKKTKNIYEIVTSSDKVLAQFHLKLTAVNEMSKLQKESWEKLRIRKVLK